MALRPPPLIEMKWFRDQFDQIHKADALILKRIGELEDAMIANPSTPVIPELEGQVLKIAKMSREIDEKVPDKTVPPRPPIPPRPPPGSIGRPNKRKG